MLTQEKTMKTGRVLAVAGLVLVVLSMGPQAWAQQQGEIAVKAGKIIPVVGDPIENGVILVRGGKITQIGQNLRIPLNARVIDASDKVVIPGLVVAHNTRGMDLEFRDSRSGVEGRAADVCGPGGRVLVMPDRPYPEVIGSARDERRRR